MREELGFDEVVLLGFSGGGSLATFHQSRAEGREATDAIMLVGAHPGRARVLRHWIDPSIIDEDDPWSVDRELDLYAPGRTTPLDREWVERYRRAQADRMRKIDARALEALERLERDGGSDRGFVVHRTTADPRFVDLTLDPSDRAAGSMYGDPRAANTAAGGLARFVTARSWLSTWSTEHSAADALTDLPRITDPTLVMSLLGDQAAFAEDSRLMAAASADPGVELMEMRHLNHYLVDQPEGLEQVISRLVDWMDRRLGSGRATTTAGLEEGQS